MVANSKAFYASLVSRNEGTCELLYDVSLLWERLANIRVDFVDACGNGVYRPYSTRSSGHKSASVVESFQDDKGIRFVLWIQISAWSRNY
jgi:hypothetical protein